MKNQIITLIFTIVFILFAYNGFSQNDGPPDPGAHGETGDQPPGGNAPIGGGLFILLGLGAAYGGRKLYNMRDEKLEE